ncbi:MAG: glucose-6-phosphate isomerase [Aquificota bacterium]|nr:MAG: glucose-6-phosphate isomerase [Aquificota bacterium]
MKISYGLALRESLRQGKVSGKALEDFSCRLERAQDWLEGLAEKGEVGFMELPFQDPGPALEIGKKLKERFKHFVLIGIGGSSLGAETLFHALKGPLYNSNPHRGGPTFHVLDNVDPVKTTEVLEEIDPAKTCFCVVSKSGSTAESMANFLVTLEVLKSTVGRNLVRRQVVFITDPEKGALRELAREEGYQTLEVPPNVGGRFSVLSAVGLLPAAVLGLDVKALLAGAARALEACKTRSLETNPAWVIAALHYLHHTLDDRRISVMMAYHERLATFADWYRQLWAESLGKEGQGQTPIKAVGAVDQHSQIQLYNEGPKDKIITFLHVEEFAKEVEIPSLYPEKPSLSYLGGHTLGELLNSELIGTASALAKNGVPSIVVTLPRVDEKTLGKLFMVYEMATAISGYLYGINPFDQPGVEEGKRLTYGLMGRQGFKDKGKEAREIWKKRLNKVCEVS